jgi:lipoyl synthase
MTERLEAMQAIGSLEDTDWEPSLLQELVSRIPDPARPIRFHIPGFKSYRTEELEASPLHPWPAISITGGECRLQCDHCRAEILKAMLPATTPTELWRLACNQIASGARGMLLSGGSNHRNEIDYASFLPVIRRIKDAFPHFRVAVHTALVDETKAHDMEAAGIDVAMMDVIGAGETLRHVYHLKRPVEDFERALASLVATRMRVVPHVVLGLHYGRFLGEWRALDVVRKHCPDALVLVVAMPHYAAPNRPFAVPDAHAVGRFFLDARRMLPDIPIQLGCARPAGRAKQIIDGYAMLAGLDGIAHPAEGMVELARRLGRPMQVVPACCSVSVDDLSWPEQSSLVAERATAPVHPLTSGKLAGIPVVAA